jgi:uncharacterized protein YndB with AHSA1/START domain
MPSSDQIVSELEIAAPVERVFAALVRPEQLSQWWGSADMYRTTWTIDQRVGGEYLCRAIMGDAPEMTVHGRFLEIDPPRRLVYTWNASWDPTGETTVVYELAPRDGATLVRVTHRGFAPDADRAGYQDGWQRILAWLDAHVAANRLVG